MVGSLTNAGLMNALTSSQGNSSTATLADSDFNTEDVDYDGSLESALALSALIAIIFAAVMCCSMAAERHRLRDHIPSQNQAKEEEDATKRKRSIEAILKVSVYSIGNTSTESTDDNVNDPADVEAQQEDAQFDYSHIGATLENGSGVFSLASADGCAICLSGFRCGQPVCESSNQECRHHFHASCMTEWLLKHPGCPVCRQDYLISS